MKSEDTSIVIKEKTERETGNVKFKMLKKKSDQGLHKNSYFHQPKVPVERI